MDRNESIQKWKHKAVSRNAEIKELKKRSKENITARERWKAKYMRQKIESDKFKREIESIKKKIELILK